MKLKADVKEKFLAALRSGEYQQGRLALRERDSYCCLGVLCDLSPIEAKDYGSQSYAWGGNRTSLSEPVINWALEDVTEWDLAAAESLHMEFDEADLQRLSDDFGLTAGGTVSAIYLNDSGVPFTVIADFLEKYL